MKLTPKQKEVIRLMREGWRLNYGNTMKRQKYAVLSFPTHAAKNVHAGTAYFLIQKKLVGTTESMPFIGSITYHLTELSNTIEL